MLLQTWSHVNPALTELSTSQGTVVADAHLDSLSEWFLWQMTRDSYLQFCMCVCVSACLSIGKIESVGHRTREAAGSAISLELSGDPQSLAFMTTLSLTTRRSKGGNNEEICNVLIAHIKQAGKMFCCVALVSFSVWFCCGHLDCMRLKL